MIEDPYFNKEEIKAFYRHIANRMAIKRAVLGISIDELSKRTKIDTITLKEYETGHKQINFEHLALIAYKLGESVTYFTDGFGK